MNMTFTLGFKDRLSTVISGWITRMVISLILRVGFKDYILSIKSPDFSLQIDGHLT